MTLSRCFVIVSWLLALSACAVRHKDVVVVTVPTSLQEVMDGIVDPAADSLWEAVETDVSQTGVEEKQPHTAQEWTEVRRKAITLIEAANLLASEERPVAVKPFKAEAAGALDSQEIQQRIAADRAAFVGFAGALRSAAQQSLQAIDARDPQALVTAGGVMDAVCEGCHMRFWYPNQVIPSLP